MKKRIAAALALTLVATAMMPATALAHHHGGGHHGSRRQATAPTYSAPAQTAAETAPLVADVCQWDGCTTIGEHCHEEGVIVAHYYGDGHDWHSEYDHYYGDGHDYHEQYDHYYGDGHGCHDQYDCYYGDGHSYHH